jgi:hypothetical protein
MSGTIPGRPDHREKDDMRILAIHADRMRYKANRKTKFAEEIDAKEDWLEDCIVLLSSVERLDEINPELVADSARKDVLQWLAKPKVTRVMIFPFAHLTSTPSSPNVALTALKSLGAGPKAAGIEVRRPPPPSAGIRNTASRAGGTRWLSGPW